MFFLLNQDNCQNISPDLHTKLWEPTTTKQDEIRNLNETKKLQNQPHKIGICNK